MNPQTYDVIILGGAFSGAAAANLLFKQGTPRKVLIIESKARFDYKVGEATVEMSGMFLYRRLGLWDYMSREQLPKQGLRYWGHNKNTKDLLESAESGPAKSVEVSSFQVQRDTLDEKILSLAVERGAELARPAKVTGVELKDYDNTVTYVLDGVEKSARAPWVIDATGKATLLGRQLGVIDVNNDHPVAALWARFANILDIDDNLYPRSAVWNGGTLTSRRLATNHFCGYGYWMWVIPLHNGLTSVGVVYDKRLIKLPAGSRRDIFLNFLNSNPGVRQLIAGAKMDEEDFRGYDQLAYQGRQYMGRGWALVGDAGGFIDPYYSPGLDHCSLTAEATSRLIGRQMAGQLGPEVIDQLIATHNDRFARGYRWFFEAVYADKYFLMGEIDLVTASFLIDTALYYMYLVRPTVALDNTQYTDLGPFQSRRSRPSHWLQSFIKARMKRIAINRIRAGVGGRINDGRRLKLRFALGRRAEVNLFIGMRLWLQAEAGNLLRAPRLWFKKMPDLAELSRMAAEQGITPSPETLAPAAAAAANPAPPAEPLRKSA